MHGYKTGYAAAFSNYPVPSVHADYVPLTPTGWLTAGGVSL
jgi:hypothetical protein